MNTLFLALAFVCGDVDADARAALALAEAEVALAHNAKVDPFDGGKNKQRCDCGCEVSGVCDCIRCPSLKAQKTAPSYPVAYARAVRERRPLVVFVGQEPVDGLGDAIVCREDTYLLEPSPSVLVCQPIGDQLYPISRLRGRPTANWVLSRTAVASSPIQSQPTAMMPQAWFAQAPPMMSFSGGGCAGGRCR